MKGVVDGIAEVRADSKKITLEIRDLEPLATGEELEVDLRKALRNEQTNPEYSTRTRGGEKLRELETTQKKEQN